MHIDNALARTVLADIQPSKRRPRPSSSLCTDCQEFDFFNSLGFAVEYTAEDLKSRAYDECDLCTLFWKTAERYGMADRGVKIGFKKAQSWLRMDGVGSPVLTICGSLDSVPRTNLQLGLPELSNPGTKAHLDTIRHWLQLCDRKTLHPNCHPPSKGLPTRVLDVGKDGDPSVELWEPQAHESTPKAEYIALSHPWGSGPHFITNIHNLEQHKRGIPIASLPSTFRDAITVTRAIGKQYLWIDSICIIQGPGGDFQTEAKGMENVFSSAYCVLAASRAVNQSSGFLGQRGGRERDYVTLYESDGKPFYICENIDSFEGHVLNSHLNTRGWVLQEHALARRTIFFAEEQTYWECGDGVRCETLTKMSNNLAAFLGDPWFPRIIMSASQGEKIIRLQNLFKTYSSLGFTNPSDRPLAVSGIQNRLLRAFDTQGGYGIFGQDEDDVGMRSNAGQKGLLRRSLLWVRSGGGGVKGKGRGLEKIRFGRGGEVPSWSWMGYMGEVDFLRPGFGTVEWMELRSPWPGRGLGDEDGDGDSEGDSDVEGGGGERRPVIGGGVRVILGSEVVKLEGAGTRLVFDDVNGESLVGDEVKCLVVGVEKEALAGDRRHYLIMLESVAGQLGVYRRIGAGYVPGRCISEEPRDGEIV